MDAPGQRHLVEKVCASGSGGVSSHPKSVRHPKSMRPEGCDLEPSAPSTGRSCQEQVTAG